MIEAKSSSSAVRPRVGFLGGGLGVLTFYLKNMYIWSRGVGRGGQLEKITWESDCSRGATCV